MNKRGLPFLIMALLVLVLWACSSGVSLGNGAAIDPNVIEGLEAQSQVEVLISLKGPDAPIEEWTRELQETNAAERQARVLAELSDKDFTLQHLLEATAALSGFLTKSGLDKLANHPDVTGIAMASGGGVE